MVMCCYVLLCMLLSLISPLVVVVFSFWVLLVGASVGSIIMIGCHVLLFLGVVIVDCCKYDHVFVCVTMCCCCCYGCYCDH